MKELTQMQVDQGDAFGLTEGTDYKIIEPSQDELDSLEDDMGPLDVDRDGLGIPELESDGGKQEASASQEDKDEDDKEKDEDGKADEDSKDGDDDGDGDADSGKDGADDDAADGDNDDDAAGGDEAGSEEQSASEPKLPKFRYDQQKAKAERLANENAALRQQLADAQKAPAQQQQQQANEQDDKPAEPTREQTLLEEKLDDLLVKKNEAIIDGNAKEAAKLEREMLGVQSDLNALTAPKPAVQEKPVDREQLKAEILAEQQMESTLDNLIEEYDALNDATESYDEKAVARVLRLQRVGIEDGLSAVEALVDAAETVFAGVKTNSELAAEQADNKEEKKPVEKKKTDVKKNIDTAKKQPASLKDDVGDDSDSAGMQDDLPDIDKLTDEEFDKLPKHIQDRMMGNVITH